MAIGALLKVGRKVYQGNKRGEELPKLIAFTEADIARPILDRFRGADRFFAARTLLDATLEDEMATKRANRQQAVQSYLDALEGEFNLARASLEGKGATQAEVAALGIAVREVSLTLDDEVNKFRQDTAAWKQQLAQSIQSALQVETNRLIREAASSIDERNRLAESRMADAGERVLKSVQEYTAKISQRVGELQAHAAEDLKIRQVILHEIRTTAKWNRLAFGAAALAAGLGVAGIFN